MTIGSPGRSIAYSVFCFLKNHQTRPVHPTVEKSFAFSGPANCQILFSTNNFASAWTALVMTDAEPKTQKPRWKQEVGCTVGQHVLRPPAQGNHRRNNRQLLDVAIGSIKSLFFPHDDAISSVIHAGERSGCQIASKRIQIALIHFDSLGFSRIDQQREVQKSQNWFDSLGFGRIRGPFRSRIHRLPLIG